MCTYCTLRITRALAAGLCLLNDTVFWFFILLFKGFNWMSDIHSLLVAAILGVVEGLTEFLPVSSTGHMIIVGHLLGFEGDTANTFEVVIQLGSILAVVVMFWRRLFGLIGIHFETAGA